MKYLLSALMGVAAVLGSPSGKANVVISGTRLIYNADEQEITVSLHNKSVVPALVQAWVDHGIDREEAPDQIDAPFVLVPPIARIEPDSQQSMRLMHTGTPLRQDQESLFWFNLLDVPPKTKDNADDNRMQVAFRSRIKLFYRPQGLPYRAEEAPVKLEWRLVATEQGLALEVHNPTPYHVTFERVELVVADQRYAREVLPAGDGNMVVPNGRQRFVLPRLKAAPEAAEVEFESIDDYGGKQPHKKRLAP